MHSHHSHSGAYCAHASPNTSPNSMLDIAYKKGFKSYCLSEHVPRSQSSQLYPEEVQADLSPEQLLQRFEEYLVEARQCTTLWKGKMKVLVGAELENIDDDCIDYLQGVLNGVQDDSRRIGSSAGKGRVDYVIGSLHHVNSIPIDFDKSTFEAALDTFRLKEETGSEDKTDTVYRKRAHLRLILRYLEQQSHLLRHFQPEVIGHFDLCRLFEPSTPMTIASSKEQDPQCDALLQQVDEAIRRNIAIVCSYQGLFEVNSASIRKGWSTPYPAQDVLDVILSQGGRLCLSDDAHSHEQVGLNFLKVKEYLESKGVQEIWMLELDDDEATPSDSVSFARGTRAVKIPNWTSDSFWQMTQTPPL